MSDILGMGSSIPDTDAMEPTPVGVKFFSVYQYTIDDLHRMLMDPNTAPSKISYVIRNNIDDLVANYEHFTNMNTRKMVQDIWRSEKFLEILHQLVSYDESIVNKIQCGEGVITINCIIYDYITCFVHQEKDPVKERMMYIAGIINRPYISEMCVTIPYYDALWISIVAKSNFNRLTVIGRMLHEIKHLNLSAEASSSVLLTYYRSGFSPVFNQYMITRNDNDTGSLFNAILSIVESMSRVQRLTLLQSYFGYSEFIKGKKVRIKETLSAYQDNYPETYRDVVMLLENGWLSYEDN